MIRNNQAHPLPEGQFEHRDAGITKVTGEANEFMEPFPKKDLVYAYIVHSTVPGGSIASIDQEEAEQAIGVIAILTPFNAPRLTSAKPHTLSILQDTEVHYDGQPIAVVLASSLPFARQAARMLTVKYDQQSTEINFKERPDKTHITPPKGHYSMESQTTIAWWEGEELNVYDGTQYISGVKMSLARTLNLPLENVHVQCPYTGGSIGSKGTAWSHVTIAAIAAKVVQKPVKLVLEHDRMPGPWTMPSATLSASVS